MAKLLSPCCGKPLKLATFYGQPIQILEGPLAGRYRAYCPACGKSNFWVKNPNLPKGKGFKSII